MTDLDISTMCSAQKHLDILSGKSGSKYLVYHSFGLHLTARRYQFNMTRALLIEGESADDQV